MEISPFILTATIQMLKDSKQMIDDLNSAYGSDEPQLVSDRISRNIEVLSNILKGD